MSDNLVACTLLDPSFRPKCFTCFMHTSTNTHKWKISAYRCKYEEGVFNIMHTSANICNGKVLCLSNIHWRANIYNGKVLCLSNIHTSASAIWSSDQIFTHSLAPSCGSKNAKQNLQTDAIF